MILRHANALIFAARTTGRACVRAARDDISSSSSNASGGRNRTPATTVSSAHRRGSHILRTKEPREYGGPTHAYRLRRDPGPAWTQPCLGCSRAEWRGQHPATPSRLMIADFSAMSRPSGPPHQRLGAQGHRGGAIFRTTLTCRFQPELRLLIVNAMTPMLKTKAARLCNNTSRRQSGL